MTEPTRTASKQGAEQIKDLPGNVTYRQLVARPEFSRFAVKGMKWKATSKCGRSNKTHRPQRKHAGSSDAGTVLNGTPYKGSDSYNWSGNVTPGVHADGVVAAWTVPTFSLPPTSGAGQHVSIWPGIGAGTSRTDTLIQAGTHSTQVFNPFGPDVQKDYFWLEAYNDVDKFPEEPIDDLPVKAGDSVFVQVWRTRTTPADVQFIFMNLSTGQGVTHYSVHPSGLSSDQAEWIVERPSIGGQYADLFPFGTQHIAYANVAHGASPTLSDTTPAEDYLSTFYRDMACNGEVLASATPHKTAGTSMFTTTRAARRPNAVPSGNRGHVPMRMKMPTAALAITCVALTAACGQDASLQRSHVQDFPTGRPTEEAGIREVTAQEFGSAWPLTVQHATLRCDPDPSPNNRAGTLETEFGRYALTPSLLRDESRRPLNELRPYLRSGHDVRAFQQVVLTLCHPLDEGR